MATAIEADIESLKAKLASLYDQRTLDLTDPRITKISGNLRQRLLGDVLPQIPNAVSTEEPISGEATSALLHTLLQSPSSSLRSDKARREIFKLFETSTGHPPFRGGLRADFVHRTVEAELFPEFFGLPSMDAVRAVADLLNLMVPFDDFTLEPGTKTSRDADLVDMLLRSGAENDDGGEEDDEDDDADEGQDEDNMDVDVDEESDDANADADNIMAAAASAAAAPATDTNVPAPGSAAKRMRGRPRSLNRYDALLLALFILKTGATHRGCGPWFNLRKTTAQRYWVYAIQWMAAGFRTLDAKFAASQKPTEDAESDDVLADFNFAVIIDGTEIWCQVPGDMMVQRAIYSEYKSHTTLVRLFIHLFFNLAFVFVISIQAQVACGR